MDEWLRDLPQKILDWLNRNWKYPSTREEFDAYVKQKRPQLIEKVTKTEKEQEEAQEEKEREILVRTLEESEIDWSRFEEQRDRAPVSRPRRSIKPTEIEMEAIEATLKSSVECCKKKCPNYKEREKSAEEKWLYWKMLVMWFFSSKDVTEVQSAQQLKDPDDLTVCYANCLAKYSIFQELIRKHLKVPNYVLPPMTVRMDESQMIKALLDPLHFYILRKYNGRKYFLPRHLEKRPLLIGDPADHPGLQSKTFTIHRPEEPKKVYTTRPVY
jgi:hypothetical protein